MEKNGVERASGEFGKAGQERNRVGDTVLAHSKSGGRDTNRPSNTAAFLALSLRNQERYHKGHFLL